MFKERREGDTRRSYGSGLAATIPVNATSAQQAQQQRTESTSKVSFLFLKLVFLQTRHLLLIECNIGTNKQRILICGLGLMTY